MTICSDNIFVNRTKKVVKNSKSIWWFLFAGWSMAAECVGVELLYIYIFRCEHVVFDFEFF